jgi:hypothetical protein
MLDSIFLFLAPISARVLEWSSTKRDGNTIHQWLAKNTCNEPAESHKRQMLLRGNFTGERGDVRSQRSRSVKE